MKKTVSQARGWTRVGIAAVATAILLVGGAIGGFAGNALFGSRTSSSTCNTVHVTNTVLPSVVTIIVAGSDDSSAQGSVPTGNGSGEIIRSNGYVVTNNHVIAPAVNGGKITVRLSDGETYPATLVGRDPKTDLAVIKITDATRLPVIATGDSVNLNVGQPVIALGSPLGLSSTVTAGIVSALGRTVPVPGDDNTNAVLAGAIQTDAAINPGNSGGALVDCSGRLVGVNTAIASVPGSSGNSSSGSVGIGFAIPVSLALPIATELIDHGSVSHPSAGATVTAIPAAVAHAFGIQDGLFVQSVVADGPAAKAGIRPGDIILTLNGHPATNVDVLTTLQIMSSAGDTVTVTLLRDRATLTATVTLQ